jgi:hypothetical protein
MRSLQPQNRKSSTSNHEISQLLSIFVGHFRHLDPDPDQTANLEKFDLLFHLGKSLIWS